MLHFHFPIRKTTDVSAVEALKSFLPKSNWLKLMCKLSLQRLKGLQKENQAARKYKAFLIGIRIRGKIWQMNLRNL